MDNVFKSLRAVPAPDIASQQAIVQLASQLGVGQFGAELCPECSGGGKRERSLSMLIEAGGQIKYHCHRASCGFSGTVYSRPDAIPSVDKATTLKAAHKPLEADLYRLSDTEVEWFAKRFNLPAESITSIRRTEHRYALPIYNPKGDIRGWITRRPWEGSPADTEEARADFQYGSKALTYMEVDEPVMSWYNTNVSIGTIYLVEDPISAMRLASYEEGYRTVALLGVRLNASKLAELQQRTFNVAIALDYDATGQAFAMARKWGQAFDSTRVIVLKKDIKDMTNEEIAELPL